MDHLFFLFAGAGGLAAILAWISIWAPRGLWIKVSALATLGLFFPAVYLSLADLLSRPKPVEMEWGQLDIAEAAVLGSQLKEEEAIFLWLGIDGLEEPRSYVLPWDQEMAEQLHDAQRKAEAEGTGVRMQQPFEQSWDRRDRKFYAAPQPPMPQKDYRQEDPLIFQKAKSKDKSDGS